MSKISMFAALFAAGSMAVTPAIATDGMAYDHVIECSSSVAVIAALVGDNPETKEVAAMMREATPKWLDKGRAMKLKSDEAVMEDHKVAVTSKLEYLLGDEAAMPDRINTLVETAVTCLDELD